MPHPAWSAVISITVPNGQLIAGSSGVTGADATTAGSIDGDADGEALGDIDGCREGIADGVALGLMLGDADGDADGSSVRLLCTVNVPSDTDSLLMSFSNALCAAHAMANHVPPGAASVGGVTGSYSVLPSAHGASAVVPHPACAPSDRKQMPHPAWFAVIGTAVPGAYGPPFGSSDVTGSVAVTMGSTDGDDDGDALGLCDGDAEGVIDGLRDGCADGLADGDADGANVFPASTAKDPNFTADE